MKTATGILGLIFMAIVGFQSLAVYGLGSLSNSLAASTEAANAAQGGAVGLVVAFLFLLGGAFAFRLPAVATFAFALAGIMGLAAGATTPFHDQTIWGVVALILGVMSGFAWRQDRKQRATPAA
ncbi:MAG: hypothetical protein QJR08_04425 [Bacillota bacterium]|nr:hypothetical protein [Bacillota bacterium]